MPIGPNFLTISEIPFLFFSTRLILPMLLALIRGRAFFYLLGGRLLLKEIMLSTCFSAIAVEGRIPRFTGSAAKSSTFGLCMKPGMLRFITVLALRLFNSRLLSSIF